MIASAIQTICVYTIPLVFAITLHEAAHGWVAEKLGDPTARMLGRITLNPIPHIDPVGTVVIPGVMILLSALSGGGGLLFGWAKPVPINTRYFRHYSRDMMLVAVAGPLSNLIQALGWALILKLFVIAGLHERFFLSVAVAGISVNLMLMAFNLIPIPPLDGGRILRGLLPRAGQEVLDRIEPYGMVVLVVLMAAGGLWFFARPFLMFGQMLVNLIL